MAVLTTEPNDGLAYFGCGFCATWTQVVVPVLDENQQPIYNDEGQQVYTTDDHEASKEMHQHDKDVHSKDRDE